MRVPIKSLFTALTLHNYRLFFVGQGISLIGTWIQRTAMAWFVYRLTNSLLLLGLLSFLSQIPSVLISPFAGVWADRWNRHKMLILTQTAALIQASLLAVLVLTGFITSTVLYPLMALSVFQGIIDAVDAPIRHSIVIDLVGDKNLIPNAIALNSAMFNGARLIGPAVAGFLIILFNEGICFTINAASYLFVIASLLFIHVKQTHPSNKTTSLTDIIEGWKYAFSNFPIRYFVTNLAVFTFFGMSYHVLLPAIAKDILQGDSQTLGYLMSMAGVGALAGALYLASRSNIRGLTGLMVIAANVVSVALIVFAFSHLLIISLLLMLILGLCMMFQMASTNTMLQSIVSDGMRGRVLSIYTMAFMFIAPLGSMVAGAVANIYGVNWTLAFSGVICLGWSLYTYRIMPLIIRSIQRMLVVNQNQSLYRSVRWIPEPRMMK